MNLIQLVSVKGKEICNAIRKLWETAARVLSNIRGEGQIPDYVLKDLAKLFLPAILKMYETDEGRAKLIAMAEERKTDGKREVKPKKQK